MRSASVLTVAALTIVACAGTSHQQAGVALDEDGIQMLFPSAPGGAQLRLGTGDPNSTSGFNIEQGTVATAGVENGVHYWSIPAYDFTYASGGAGKTSRLHLYASGGTQQFTWKTQHGYLSSPADVRDQELTVYARVHGVFDAARATLTLKIRGGKHSSSDGDLASCVMLTYQLASTGALVRFGKELFHPNYDYVKLQPQGDAQLAEGRWVGLKMVSWNAPGDATRVVNRIYVDADPFDATGRPKNGWKLYGEYVDVEGTSTGQYAKLVDWGGWETTFRSDGFEHLDFALVGVRAIVAPR